MAQAHDADAGTPRPRPRRWRRRLIGAGVLLVTLVSLAWYVVTRGPVPTWIVASLARGATGCDYQADSTQLIGGRLIIEGLSLRVPGIEGPGGEVVSARFVRVDLDWSGWMTGDIRAIGVVVSKPVIRLSQSPTGELNIAMARARGPRPAGTSGIDAPSGAGPTVTPTAAGKPIGLPHVRADDGVIELGEHNGPNWTALVRLPVEGGVTPIAGTIDRYAIRLMELRPPSPMPDSGVRIEGEYDALKGEAKAKLSGLALDQWSPDTVPLAVRRAWRDLALDGKLTGAEVRYSPAKGFEGRISLGGIAMSLPVPTEKNLVDAPRVRVTNVTGTISVTQGIADASGAATGGLEAAIRGIIEDLPCQINLRTTGLDPDTADIECEVLSEGFDMRKTWALRPFAPPLVVERIEQFSGPTATVDARTKVRRVSGRWSYAGSVIFQHGRAAFDHFPYPFVDIAGRVEFDDERVKIVGLTGRGLTGARLVATGEIKPPDEATYVDIHIDVRDAPIDSVLAAAIDRRTGLAREALWTPREEALKSLLAGPAMPERPGATVFDRLLGPERYRELLGNERTWRMGLYQALFCDDEHARLVASGLVLTPADRARLEREATALRARRDAAPESERQPLTAEIDALDRRLAAPEFAFGGMIDTLSVDVRYAPDTKRHYDTDITIAFRDAGLVPEPFPFPVRATNLVVKVREEYLAFEGKNFKGLRGGEADISGTLDITDPDRTAKVPAMTITARQVPVDELVISAVPERMGVGSPGGSSVSGVASESDGHEITASAILRGLNLTGAVDCTAKVWQREDGEAGYDVEVNLADIESRPLDVKGENRVAISDLTGRVRVTDQALDIPGLSGAVALGDCPPGDEHAPGQVSFSAHMNFAATETQPAGAFTARVGAERVDLAWPMEDVVAAASPRAAATLAELRQTHQPSGRVDAIVTLGPSRVPGVPADALHIAADVSTAKNFSFLVLGGRMTLQQQQGTIGVHVDEGAATATPPQPGTSIAFSGAVGEVAFDGLPSGRFTATGKAAVNAADERLVPMNAVESLHVSIERGVLESGLTRRVIGGAAGQAVADWLTTHDVRGNFEASLILDADPTLASAWRATGSITPLRVALTRAGQTALAEPVTGEIALNGPVALLKDIRLTNPDWSVRVNGEFRTGAVVRTGPAGPGAWELEASLEADARGLPASLAAILPEGVVTGMAAMALAPSPPSPLAPVASTTPPSVPPTGFRLTKADLLIGGHPASKDWYSRAAFRSELAFSTLATDVGIALTDASGLMLVDVRQPEGQPFPTVRLDITMPAVRAAGLTITDAGCVVTTGQRDGEWLVPVISGRSASGTLAGSAFIRPPAAANISRGIARGREYALRLEAAGVRLSDMLADIERHSPAPALLPTRSPSDSNPGTPPSPPPVERGLLTANLAVAGLTGDPASRQGAGSIVIAGGDVVGVPLMAPMLELSNLIPPIGDKLNYLQGQFFVRGPTLTFEDIRLQSATVEVVGSGTMTTPDMGLNLRFNSRGRARLPIWSDILEGLRNEVLTTTVTGTLRDPKFGSESLSGTRRLLSGIFGEPARTPVTPVKPGAQPKVEQATAPVE